MTDFERALCLSLKTAAGIRASQSPSAPRALASQILAALGAEGRLESTFKNRCVGRASESVNSCRISYLTEGQAWSPPKSCRDCPAVDCMPTLYPEGCSPQPTPKCEARKVKVLYDEVFQ